MNRISSVVMALMLFNVPAAAENWPQWRGPSADGVSRASDAPVRWSRDENVAWSARLPGWGTSSPVIWEDLVFVTTQAGAGERIGSDFAGAVQAKNQAKEGPIEFAVLAFDKQTGERVWDYRFEAAGEIIPVHVKHNLASPSCVTDGERVYAWFGTGQLVALDMEGNLVWKRHLGEEFGPFDIRWGHGSSPMLYKDSLILLCDHPPHSYLLAVDKETGEQRWRVDRGEGMRSYTTPFLVETGEGDLLILNTNEHIEAVDPANGKTLWTADEFNKVPVATPVYHDGVLYSTRGYRSGPYLALRLSGRDEKPETLWRVPTGAPYVPSILYYRGLIYMATERGIVTCVDAGTGKTVWRERFDGVFTASPVAADGKVYLINEAGRIYVLEAGRELKIIAENEVGERVLASPAISDGKLFIRSDDGLFAIGEAAGERRTSGGEAGVPSGI